MACRGLHPTSDEVHVTVLLATAKHIFIITCLGYHNIRPIGFLVDIHSGVVVGYKMCILFVKQHFPLRTQYTCGSGCVLSFNRLLGAI